MCNIHEKSYLVPRSADLGFGNVLKPRGFRGRCSLNPRCGIAPGPPAAVAMLCSFCSLKQAIIIHNYFPPTTQIGLATTLLWFKKKIILSKIIYRKGASYFDLFLGDGGHTL